MSNSLVTIAVIPRERFSHTKESLESIFANTKAPYEMVYVDGGSPPKVRQYIEKMAAEKNFPIIKTKFYLSPNRARKMSLKHVKTKYVVFIDNDVIVEPGWLEAMIKCAEETNATIVGPLTCQGRPLASEVHYAGGKITISEKDDDNKHGRFFRSKMFELGRPYSESEQSLKRQATDFAEYHCVMIRKDIFDKEDVIDENMLNTMEHIDLAMMVKKCGGTIYFEPDSVVTYLAQPPLERQDLFFYMTRWNDQWERKSLQHFQKKWNLTEDQFFKNRYKNIGYRRKNMIIKPFISNVPSWKIRQVLIPIFVFLDKILNRILMIHYNLKQAK